MKNVKFIIAAVLLVFLSACSDYLDIVPDNVATMDNAFTDKVSAERFLATVYSYMPRIGDPKADPALLASDEFGTVENSWNLSDFHYYGNRIKLGQQNTNAPLMNYWEGSNEGRGLFIALRDCNIFLENIHKVGSDLPDDERARWISEVKFFKAFYHYYLLRMYGPVPLIKENKEISSGVEEVKVYREPFDDCVEYIVQLCDEAMEGLPLTITNVASEMGRITKPVAATLRAEVLVMAASPLFNGNADFSSLADNRGIKLFSDTEDPAKWGVAATACKAAIDICKEAEIDLYTFSDSRYQMSDTTRVCMSVRGAATIKWNQELIWGNPVNTNAKLQSNTLPYLRVEDRQGKGPDPEFYPTFKMAELFYSNNGVPIEEDTQYPYSERYETVKIGTDHKYYIKDGLTTAVLNTYREPRFYADLGFDCGYWYGNGRTKDVGMGSATETPWILACKQGEISGKSGDIRYSLSGYFAKKASNFETATTTNGDLTVTRNTFPIMRLADLYLLYAEALNESLDAPTTEIYQYIDLVRERAGLKGVVESWSKYSKIPEKPLNKTGLRSIIQQERLIELCFESKRYWDIRRWKLAHIYYNQVEKGWNVDQKTVDEYYNVIITGQLEFSTKQYLWPIREGELRKNVNLVQNPYWE